MTERRVWISDSAAMEALGARLAGCCKQALTVYLVGDLGAGKTTLVRGFLHGLGHAGPVRSPTYTLVEPYPTVTPTVYHFDLYRLADPEELEFLGVRDYFAGDAVCLIEWPDKGAGYLPPADLEVHLLYAGTARDVMLLPRSEAAAEVADCATSV